MYTPKGEINDNLYEAMKKTEVVEKLAAAKSPEECYDIVKATGVEATFEEFQKFMEIMKSYLEESQDGVLSEDDLDQVAGGKGRKTAEDAKLGLEVAGAAVGVIGSVVGAVAAAV